MHSKTKFLLTGLLIVFICGCSKDNADKADFKAMDTIAANRYYSSDIMPDSYKNVYGNWRANGTSGGLSGAGYKTDFDFLVFKANGIFGIIRHDSLLAFGKMVLSQSEGSLLCRFDFDKSARIELCADPEKYIQLIHQDTLNLNAPCCDRYNTHLVRVK